MEFKGTKGSWKTYDFKGVGSCIDIIRDCGNDELEPQIAQVYSMEETDYKTPHNEELKANARLMAAAPDLFKACNMARIEIAKGTADTLTVDVLEKAVLKALGENV